MIDLQPEQYDSAAALFQGTHYGALTAATLEGTHPGRVFIDQIDQPSAALVCTRVPIGYYFLAGEPNPTVIDSLNDLFTNDLERAQSPLSLEFLLFLDSPEWHGPLFAGFSARRPLLIHKKRLVLPDRAKSQYTHWEAQPLSGMQVVPYTAELLSECAELASEVELFYGSVEAFLRHSWGFAVMDRQAGNWIPASSCCAVLTGAGEAETSIQTHPDYRRKGLGRLAASAYIVESLARGFTPVWGCWPENVPSVSLARALGFVDDTDQPACLWVNSPDWNIQ